MSEQAGKPAMMRREIYIRRSAPKSKILSKYRIKNRKSLIGVAFG